MFINTVIIAIVSITLVLQICLLALLISMRMQLPTAIKNETWYQQQISEKDKYIGELRSSRDDLSRQNSAYRKILGMYKEDEIHRMEVEDCIEDMVKEVLTTSERIRNPSNVSKDQ